MKRLLALFLTVFSVQASAWESTAGLSYEHRRFSADDQLGAISSLSAIRPEFSNGMRISGSFLWDVGRGFLLGPDASFGYGILHAPHQKSYIVPAVGELDTSNLMTQSVVLSAKFQVFERESQHFFLKPGFLLTNLTSGWSRVDADTGAIFSLEASHDLNDRSRISFDLQALLSPTIRGRAEYDISWAFVLGIQQVFRSQSSDKISEPVKSAAHAHEQVIAVKVPDAPTPVAPPVEPTSTVPAQPAPVVAQPAAMKHTAILKLDSGGKLSAESYPTIQKIFDAYKLKPSIIKIQHRTDEQTNRLVQEIVSWLLKAGCDTNEITLISVDNLEKPIKINLLPK